MITNILYFLALILISVFTLIGMSTVAIVLYALFVFKILNKRK